MYGWMYAGGTVCLISWGGTSIDVVGLAEGEGELLLSPKKTHGIAWSWILCSDFVIWGLIYLFFSNNCIFSLYVF